MAETRNFMRLHCIRAEEVEVASDTHPPEAHMTRLEAVERDATRLSMTFQCLPRNSLRRYIRSFRASIARASGLASDE